MGSRHFEAQVLMEPCCTSLEVATERELIAAPSVRADHPVHCASQHATQPCTQSVLLSFALPCHGHGELDTLLQILSAAPAQRLAPGSVWLPQQKRVHEVEVDAFAVPVRLFVEIRARSA